MATKEKLARRCKEQMVKEIKDRIRKRPNFVLTHYMGSSVSDLELLRRNLKKSSSSYFVVKNSILKVVFDELKFGEASEMIEGGMGLSLCGDDPVLSCKELVTFEKDHNKFKIKAAYLDGKMVPLDRVKTMASLPPKDVLLAMVLGGIKSPITGFVYALSGIVKKFVYVVDAIKVSKEKTENKGGQADGSKSRDN